MKKKTAKIGKSIHKRECKANDEVPPFFSTFCIYIYIYTPTSFSLQYFHQGLLTVTLMMFLAAMFPKIDMRGGRAISLFFHLHELFANPLVLPTYSSSYY